MVDKEGVVPIMGKQASETVKLIKVHNENILAIGCNTTSENPTNGQWTMEQIKAEYALVMDVLTAEYKTEVDDTVKRVQLPKRCVPVGMMKLLKEKL